MRNRKRNKAKSGEKEQCQSTETIREGVVEKINKKSSLVIMINAAITLLYSIVNGIYDIQYKVECQEFYRLPQKYFRSSVNSRLLYLGCIIVFLLMMLLPCWLKKFNQQTSKKNRLEIIPVILVCIALGLAYGMINYLNMCNIISGVKYKEGIFIKCNEIFNKYPKKALFIAIFIGVLWTCLLTFYKEISLFCHGGLKKMLNILYFLSGILSLLLLLYGTIFKLNTSVKDQTGYEFGKDDTGTYVVISECEDNVVLVEKYDIINKRFYFNTDEYTFKEKTKLIFCYKNLKYPPIIQEINEKN